jgi:hypothetical protein
MENKWEIEYRDNAKEELEDVIKKNSDLKELIIQRLEALEDFPPDKWFELRRHLGHDLFTSDSQIVRISGEADFKARTVFINKVTVRRKLQ